MGPFPWERKSSKRLRSSGEIPADPNAVEFQHLPLESDSRDKQRHTSGLNTVLGYEDRFLQYGDLKSLPRSMDVFRKIERDPILSLRLPRPDATAGRVLEHACCTFERLLSDNKPMSFKFGITHDPAKRWHNPVFGYRHSKDRYDFMMILFAASNPHGPSFLEAALIKQYKSFLIACSAVLYCTSSELTLSILVGLVLFPFCCHRPLFLRYSRLQERAKWR